jgi:RNA polymerase sigma-70 factor, ECF subfamily
MEYRQSDEIGTLYQQYRPLLFSLSYRMLGSVTDAEDMVQDIFLRLPGLDLSRIENVKAFLCKMTTNRCLDLLKSAQRNRETYVGPWLPEPLLDTEPRAEDPQDLAVRSESVSYALLTLLSRFNPVDRAVFLLREAFSFDYHEIAVILGKSEVNCRKIYSRVRSKLQPEEEVPIHEPLQSRMFVESFLRASSSGDVNAFVKLLAEDAVLYSDGGGKVYAAIHPVVSRDRVLAFLFGIANKAVSAQAEIRMTPVRMNGELGIAIEVSGEPFTFMAFRISGGQIRDIYILRNPDKLQMFVDSR